MIDVIDQLLYRAKVRWALAVLVAAVMRYSHTDFRFSKDYRWGTTRFHRIVYTCFCTFAANLMADAPRFWPAARHWFKYL